MASNPDKPHRVLGFVSMLAAVVNSLSAILFQPEPWVLVPVFLCCAGFVYAGTMMVVLSAGSGSGRDIIIIAQVAGTCMLGWALLWLRVNPHAAPMLMGPALVSGLLAFGLAVVAYPRAILLFFAPVVEAPPDDPEPPETPPIPANPDLHRYSHVLLKLRSRGYR